MSSSSSLVVITKHRGADPTKKQRLVQLMSEQELRSLASRAPQGAPAPYNEGLLRAKPEHTQLALAELGRRWQRWDLFKCTLPSLPGLDRPMMRMTAEYLAAASQGALDPVGVLAIIRYVDTTRGKRGIWLGDVKRPLEAHLHALGLTEVASNVPLGHLFGLEPRALAADEDGDEVSPGLDDMASYWESHSDRRLAEAREWVGRFATGACLTAS
jgi:hypothetical protein